MSALTDTQVLQYIADHVDLIDNRNPQIIMTLETGQSFVGFTLQDCVTQAIAAGFPD